MARVPRNVDPEKIWGLAQRTLRRNESEQDRIKLLISLARLGQCTTFTADGQPAAILPHVPVTTDPNEQQAIENRWQDMCLAMHNMQNRDLNLPEKLEANNFARRGTAVDVFQVAHVDRESKAQPQSHMSVMPKAFHELPKEERDKLLKRGN